MQGQTAAALAETGLQQGLSNRVGLGLPALPVGGGVSVRVTVDGGYYDVITTELRPMVSDVIPGQVSLGVLQRILQRLLSERVSVRDMPTILEGIAEAAAYTKNIGSITEHVRARLSRQLCDAYANVGGVLPLATLSPDWEQAFNEALVGGGEDQQLAMPPSQLQQFISDIRTAFEKFSGMGEMPVLLTSPAIRPYVRSVVERFRPQTIVMSQNEIHPKARIKTLGQI